MAWKKRGRYSGRLVATASMAALTLGFVPTALAPAWAQGDELVHNLDIPAQPLQQALIDFSRQTGLQIVAAPDTVAGITSRPVSGRMSSATALTLLLGESGLSPRTDRDVVVLVADEPAGPNAQPQTIETTQTPPPDADEPVAEKVIVTGYRDSLASSLEAKRSANQIIDVITAEDIGQFPDQNVAEAIQRITGVQITRNNGEGETVNIRGLSANFTRIEVDGRSASVTIDSADPERQSVLSVFASDLYNEIEVVKSPTAADIEGGVGGIVRLKTPDPLDIGELKWGVDAGYTDADARDEGEPSLNAFVSNVFGDGKVGVLLSGTFEDRDRSIDKIQNNDNWWTVDSRANGGTDPAITEFADYFFPGRLRQEERDESADKYNLNAKLQVQATDSLQLYADAVMTREERDRRASRIQIAGRRGRPALLSDFGSFTDPILVDDASQTVLALGFTGARTDLVDFRRFTDIETVGASAGFEFDNQIWTLRGEANVQSSEEDFDEYQVSSRVNADFAYSIVNDPEYPEIILPAGQFDPADLDLRQLQFERRTISIDDSSARLDAERFFGGGFFSSAEAGLRWGETEFDRKQGALQSPALDDLTFADGVPMLAMGQFADGYGGANLLRTWPSIDPLELYQRFPSSDDPYDAEFADENLWSLKEATLAAYGLVNFDTENRFGLHARGNLGVRVIQTDYEGGGAVDLAGDGIDDYGNIGLQTLERDYSDVLPSFNIVMSSAPESNFLVRGAVSRALTRPEIQAMNPGLVIRIDDPVNDGDPATEEGTFEEGNPDLDPFRAWQYDLGFEWYFDDEGESAITATLFYKDVENFVTIEDQMRTYQNIDLGVGVDAPVDILSENFPINGGEAEVKGLELGFQTPLSFLPGFWSDFGVFANYTYTDSEFTNDAGVTQPFPGASENSFNIVGYYERGGFSGRLAYNYRDEYLIVPFQTDEFGDSAADSNAEFGDAQGRLDLALRYNFENGVRLSFDALNLTEEQSFKYYDVTNRLEDLEVEGRIYSVRVGYVY